MNSMERTVAAVTFAKPDRIPVIPQVFGHAAILAGIPLDEYIRDGELLARCQLDALRHYDYDAVFTVVDVNVETEALGSTLKYRENSYAFVEQYALSPTDNFGKLTIPDPDKAGRMPQVLTALKILRRELSDTVPIVGCVMGPLTLATQVLGTDTALFLAIDEPGRFAELLDFCTLVATRFGLAQLRAGAHLPIIFDPAASPAVVPSQFFREFELPRLTRVFEAFKSGGAPLNWLHIAGPSQSVLPFYPEAGVDLANIDYYVTGKMATELLPRTCVDGNIGTLAFVESEPEEIRTEAETLLRFFAGRGGFILSSGCEIPPEAKPANIAAMVEAARSAG